METSALCIEEGLHIESVSDLYRESQAVSKTTSHLKADRQVTVWNLMIPREREYTLNDFISNYSKYHFLNCTANIPDLTGHLYVDTVKRKVLNQ